MNPSASPSSPSGDLLTVYRHSLLARYTDQVDALGSDVEAVSDADRRRPLAPGEWSPHEVVWHVDAVESQVYQVRLARLVEEEHPLLADFDLEGWMAAHYTDQESTDAIVARIAQGRRTMRRRLEQVPVAAWGRTGFHSRWGTRTLMWWVERSISHLTEHARQLRGSQAAGQ